MQSNFMTLLLSKERWESSGGNTVKNPGYNQYPVGDWRRDCLEAKAKNGYYPPAGAIVKIIPGTISRSAYTVKHGNSDIAVPAVELETFQMEVTGKEFQGKAALNSGRFIVNCDHAVSNPLIVSDRVAVVVHVRLRTLDDGSLVMVNELIWQRELESNQSNSASFYDIQKWYCCGYP